MRMGRKQGHSQSSVPKQKKPAEYLKGSRTGRIEKGRDMRDSGNKTVFFLGTVFMSVVWVVRAKVSIWPA